MTHGASFLCPHLDGSRKFEGVKHLQLTMIAGALVLALDEPGEEAEAKAEVEVSSSVVWQLESAVRGLVAAATSSGGSAVRGRGLGERLRLQLLWGQLCGEAQRRPLAVFF